MAAGKKKSIAPSRRAHAKKSPVAAGLEELTTECLTLYGLAMRAELISFAMSGVCRAIHSLEVDPEHMEAFFEPVTRELAEFYAEMSGQSRRLVEIRHRLGGLTPEGHRNLRAAVGVTS